MKTSVGGTVFVLWTSVGGNVFVFWASLGAVLGRSWTPSLLKSDPLRASLGVFEHRLVPKMVPLGSS